MAGLLSNYQPFCFIMRCLICSYFFFKNDVAATGIVTFMYAGPHFFTPDNCLLQMDAPQKPTIYLWFSL